MAKDKNEKPSNYISAKLSDHEADLVAELEEVTGLPRATAVKQFLRKSLPGYIEAVRKVVNNRPVISSTIPNLGIPCQEGRAG